MLVQGLLERRKEPWWQQPERLLTVLLGREHHGRERAGRPEELADREPAHRRRRRRRMAFVRRGLVAAAQRGREQLARRRAEQVLECSGHEGDAALGLQHVGARRDPAARLHDGEQLQGRQEEEERAAEHRHHRHDEQCGESDATAHTSEVEARVGGLLVWRRRTQIRVQERDQRRLEHVDGHRVVEHREDPPEDPLGVARDAEHDDPEERNAKCDKIIEPRGQQQEGLQKAGDGQDHGPLCARAPRSQAGGTNRSPLRGRDSIPHAPAAARDAKKLYNLNAAGDGEAQENGAGHPTLLVQKEEPGADRQAGLRAFGLDGRAAEARGGRSAGHRRRRL